MTVPFFLMQKRLSMLSMLPVAVERSNWGRPMRWIKIVITEVFILLVVGDSGFKRVQPVVQEDRGN